MRLETVEAEKEETLAREVRVGLAGVERWRCLGGMRKGGRGDYRPDGS